MGFWVGVISADDFATERLYANDAITFPPLTSPPLASPPASPPTSPPLALAPPTPARVGRATARGPAAGDQVVLVALTEPRVVFGVGRVAFTSPTVAVRYTYRLFDTPAPLDDEVSANRPVGLSRLAKAEFDRLNLVAPTVTRAEWFVSVALPIEASSRAEAVREFWTYVDKLGPRELPAFVWPRGDELAMQAFVLGEVANQDPEEDDD